MESNLVTQLSGSLGKAQAARILRAHSPVNSASLESARRILEDLEPPTQASVTAGVYP